MQGVIKFIWLAIYLSIVAFIFPIFRDHYLLGQYGVNEIPYQVTKQWELISYLFIAFKNIAAASWLFWLALKDKVNKIAWVVFGLFFGLIAVALYYLVRINGKVET